MRPIHKLGVVVACALILWSGISPSEQTEALHPTPIQQQPSSGPLRGRAVAPPSDLHSTSILATLASSVLERSFTYFLPLVVVRFDAGAAVGAAAVACRLELDELAAARRATARGISDVEEARGVSEADGRSRQPAG